MVAKERSRSSVLGPDWVVGRWSLAKQTPLGLLCDLWETLAPFAVKSSSRWSPAALLRDPCGLRLLTLANDQAPTTASATAVPLTPVAQPISLKEKSKDNPVAVKSVQLGQVWRQDTTGQDFLVTKVYSEVFSQFAVLRPAEVNAPDAPTVKVKVAKSADGASLPGFTFTQEGSF
jgi:hypothetical protein